EASCSRITSSTSRPQRRMHFSMFCTAFMAQVTRCTLASRRTPDMPRGSRTPSWLSMTYSWGRVCSTRWSAGMATAWAASSTRSRSALLTSRSRMATMPWEFRLRMWLPARPTKAEWIRQPAISWASSTARWIDCTVDSILTTTPFFNPRDGCVPIPTISRSPSGVTSPTRATTLEVPISSPTIILPLCTLDMFILSSILRGDGHVRRRRIRFVPRNGQTVGVAQIDPRNVLALLHQRLLVDGSEAPHFFDYLVAPQQQLDTLAGGQEPAAAGAQFQSRDGETQGPQ